MAAIYSNGSNRWNILGFNFTKRDALSSLYKISMIVTSNKLLLPSFFVHNLPLPKSQEIFLHVLLLKYRFR